MEIVTERTILRLIKFSDIALIHGLHSIPEVDEFNTLGIPNNINETKSVIEPWIEENWLAEGRNRTFIIEGKPDTVFIGMFGLKLGSKKYRSAEVWYKIHPDCWRQGYATESLRAVIKYGFETLKLHRIEAGCAVNNLGSIKVLEKSGMIREGRGRETLPLKSGWSDHFAYAILETDV